MTGVLPTYLRRRIGVQILAMLLLLTAMMQLLELLDITTDILERGLGAAGLLRYVLLRLPPAMALALPLAVLLGSITALHPMARQLEITAMRMHGVSLTRMYGHLLPMLLLLAAGQLALMQWVLPTTESRLREWWNATAPPAASSKPRWVQTSAGPLSIDRASPDGRRLDGVMLYTRDATGLLTGRLKAARATWDGRAWQLQEVTELQIVGNELRTRQTASRAWQTNLHPDEVLRLDLSRPALSGPMIADLIAGTRVRSQPVSYYQTALYRSFTAPLGVFIMLLLALPTASAPLRPTGWALQIPVALALGLCFLLADGIAASLGSSGRLPALPAALAAPLLFAGAGWLRLRASERA